MEEGIFAELSSDDSRNAFEELEIDSDLFSEIGRRALDQRLTATENHAKTYPGTVMWHEAVAQLREELGTMGWSRLDPRNLPLIVHPDGTSALTVVTGDSHSGIAKGNPQSKYKKGVQFRALLSSNATQVRMALGDAEEALGSEFNGVCWVLLLHCDERNAELRMEVSLPASMDREGRINGWSHRVILPAIPFIDDSISMMDDVDYQPDTTVEVTRNGN